MARQAGPHYFIGTIGDLIFYKLGDNYYVRQKGEPTTGTQKKLKDKNHYPVLNFRKQEFGRASKLASEVYRFLPRKLKGHGIQQKMTGKAVRLLRQGIDEETIKARLRKEMMPAEQSLQPVERPEVEGHDGLQNDTIIEAVHTSLSNWQVSALGVLGEDTIDSQEQSVSLPKELKALPRQNVCAPCMLIAPRPPL